MSFPIETITYDGADLRVRSGTHDIEMVREIFEDRYYTCDGWDVHDGAVVLDIGGGIGAFAVFAARCGAAAVYTFEPMPDSFALLSENVEQYAAVRAECAAVATEEGEVMMSGFEPMPDGLINTGTPAISSEGLSVRAIDVHDVLAFELVWDVVKLDIEGYEYELLESLTPEELDKIRMITMEFHHDGDESETKARGDELGLYLYRYGFSRVEVDWAYGQQGRLRARR